MLDMLDTHLEQHLTLHVAWFINNSALKLV